MTKNGVIVMVLIAILAIGGISYWAMNKSAVPITTDVNINVDQTPSNTNTDLTPTTKEPGVPVVTSQASTSVSQSTVVLNGSVNPDGVQTSYWYEYGLTDVLGTFTSRQLIGGGYLAYSAPSSVSGLTPNTTYYYRVAAENQYGKVYGAILNFKTTNTPPISFVAPTGETKNATDIGQTSATLNGNTNPNGIVTFYWFEYGQNPTLGNTTAIASAGGGVSNASVSAPVSGLAPNTTYYFRFNLQNGYGIANGNILNFTTSAVNPLPPTGIGPTATTEAATNISKTGATLHGQINPNGSQTNYYFEYGKSTLFGIFSFDQKTNAKSVGGGTKSIAVSPNVSNLDADSIYYYRVVATNSYGTTSGGIFSFATKKP